MTLTSYLAQVKHKYEDVHLDVGNDMRLLLLIVERQREVLAWYASHDPELTSEYSRAGLYKNAQKALSDIEELLSEEE